MSIWHDRNGQLTVFARLWNFGHRLLLRLRILDCLYCDNTGDRCDCGVDGVPWEVSAGLHYQWCMVYNGCDLCGRGRPK